MVRFGVSATYCGVRMTSGAVFDTPAFVAA
jgi:hypothetical protein